MHGSSPCLLGTCQADVMPIPAHYLTVEVSRVGNFFWERLAFVQQALVCGSRRARVASKHSKLGAFYAFVAQVGLASRKACGALTQGRGGETLFSSGKGGAFCEVSLYAR